MDFAASFTLTSECRSCKMSPNRSSLDKSTSFCKTQLTKNVNDDLLDLKSLILSITHRETHLCRSFDITVHEKALDGVWFCHNRLFHVLLGIWTFNTFSCKHIMKYNSLLKLRMHQKKNKSKNCCDCIPLLFSTTSSSKSSSKISLPSSTYPVPSDKWKLN